MDVSERPRTGADDPPMFRAVAAVLVMTAVLVVLGGPILLIGLVHPIPALGSWLSWVWARSLLATCRVDLSVEGAGDLTDGRPRFFVGNHQSALDIPVLVVILKGRIRFMAKHTLFWVPLFGWLIWRYAYAPVNRSSPRATLRSLNHMLERLQRRPISFVVFPEGTRSRDGRLLPFRQGTMRICQRAGLDIVPFAIDGSRAVHQPKAWRIKPGPVRVAFARPIPAAEAGAASVAELNERLRHEVRRCLETIRTDREQGDHPVRVVEEPSTVD
jgi:1-acyl-sn-glycerol-3-phosphate acyltransferase